MKIITISSFVAAVIAVGATYFISTKPAVAQNEPLKIILPAGSTGSFNARFQIMKPLLEKEWGNKVELIYGKNCVLAKKLIDSETSPVLTIWMPSENINPACDMPIKDQNIIAVETDGLRFCTANITGLTAKDLLKPGNTHTIGVTNPFKEYVRWIDGLNKAANTNLKAVPFGSSGKARKGVLAGDVDFILISPSNSNKLMKSGGSCFFTTLSEGEPKWKLPALKDVVNYDRAEFPQGYFYAAYNMSESQLKELRSLYASIAEGKSKSFNKFAGGKDIKMQGTKTITIEKMREIMTSIYNTWKN